MSEMSRRTFVGNTALVSGGVIAGSARVTPAAKGDHKRRSMTDLRQALRGVHLFLTTPFGANYELDSAGLRNNVAYHAERQTENLTIVVGGGMGELFSLNVHEHKEMVQAAAEGARGKMPVVAGVAGGYGPAFRAARNAEQAGADAILLFTAPYWKGSVDSTFQYFRDVANSVRIGVLVCNVHGYREAVHLEPYWPEVLRRLSSVSNVIGFEDSSGGLDVGRALGELVHDEFLWIARGDNHAQLALPAGAKAYTAAVGTFVPSACREFWQRGVSGDTDRMQDIFRMRIKPMARIRQLKPGYGVSGVKAALQTLGRAGGRVRPPGIEVLTADRPKIAQIAQEFAET